MMKRLLVVAALATVAAFASAQNSAIGSPVNLSFRAGIVFPLDDVTRDLFDNMVGIGAEYYLDRSLLEGGETTFSFDWIGRGLNGDKGNIFPIMLNQRWYVAGDFESANRRYYYLGLGVAVIDVVHTNTVAAARVGIGQEFGPHVFGEATFVYSDSSSGARATSIGAYVGYRF
jgi:hypothetical protein